MNISGLPSFPDSEMLPLPCSVVLPLVTQWRKQSPHAQWSPPSSRPTETPRQAPEGKTRVPRCRLRGLPSVCGRRLPGTGPAMSPATDGRASVSHTVGQHIFQQPRRSRAPRGDGRVLCSFSLEQAWRDPFSSPLTSPPKNKSNQKYHPKIHTSETVQRHNFAFLPNEVLCSLIRSV